MSCDRPQAAKQYEARHNLLFLVETIVCALGLWLVLVTGASTWLAGIVANPWLASACYVATGIVAGKLLLLPLAWYGGYALEHRYGLSNETVAGWCWDETKSLGVSLTLGVPVFVVVYALLRALPDWWWLAAAGFLLVFGVVLTSLFPVVLLPLFYKSEPLADETLRGRLTALAERSGARVLGVYRLDLSAKTKKANAALAGLGRTKRILLGDTLLNGFAVDEIEVVLAHELAHYRHGDLWKLIAWNSVTTLVGLKAADVLVRAWLPRYGFTGVADLGAFPLLALALLGFGLVTMPVNHAFGRWRERKADAGALALTGNPAGFIRAMQKLADQNLADAAPHPAIEFVLHDHPALARRIAMAEQWQPG